MIVVDIPKRQILCNLVQSVNDIPTFSFSPAPKPLLRREIFILVFFAVQCSGVQALLVELEQNWVLSRSIVIIVTLGPVMCCSVEKFW